MSHRSPLRPVRSRRDPTRVGLVVGAVLAAVVAAVFFASSRGSEQAAPVPEPPAPVSPPPSPSPDLPATEPPGPTFPDETTTGVPAGVELEKRSSMVVTEDGARLDRLDIEGTVTVDADDVTISRSRITGLDGGDEGDYAIYVEPGSDNLLVTDVEIVGAALDTAAVCCSDYTLRRVNIHDIAEGPRVGSRVSIEDSYIHHLRRCRDRSFDEGCHVDVLQSTGGEEIVIRGNSLQAYNPDTDDPMNAAYQFGEEEKELRGVRFEDNLVNGGSYTINGGGGGTRDGEVIFRGNRFQRDSRYGPVHLLGPNVDIDTSNVWDDSGEPIDTSDGD